VLDSFSGVCLPAMHIWFAAGLDAYLWFRRRHRSTSRQHAGIAKGGRRQGGEEATERERGREGEKESRVERE
jgi:hypothetical protein